jgi:hypothetical protein
LVVSASPVIWALFSNEADPITASPVTGEVTPVAATGAPVVETAVTAEPRRLVLAPLKPRAVPTPLAADWLEVIVAMVAPMAMLEVVSTRKH